MTRSILAKTLINFKKQLFYIDWQSMALIPIKEI